MSIVAICLGLEKYSRKGVTVATKKKNKTDRITPEQIRKRMLEMLDEGYELASIDFEEAIGITKASVRCNIEKLLGDQVKKRIDRYGSTNTAIYWKEQ